MSMKFPKTTNEYRPIEIEGKGLWKVRRVTYVQTTIAENSKKIVRISTVLKNVGKSEAEEYVYKKDRGL